MGFGRDNSINFAQTGRGGPRTKQNESNIENTTRPRVFGLAPRMPRVGIFVPLPQIEPGGETDQSSLQLELSGELMRGGRGASLETLQYGTLRALATRQVIRSRQLPHLSGTVSYTCAARSVLGLGNSREAGWLLTGWLLTVWGIMIAARRCRMTYVGTGPRVMMRWQRMQGFGSSRPGIQ